MSSQRLEIPPNVMVREVGGESVILDLDTERYFGLDEVGTLILREIKAGAGVDAAVDEVLRVYDADADLVRRDVDALVASLLDRGLLRAVVDNR